MDFDPAELDTLSREDLILRARARGVERPEQMTRIELRDEIVRLSEPDLERQRRTRGWLGVARDLLASVVESGLNLPDAAAAIRGDGKALHDFQGPPPVATVTLAEIYAAQGHYEQALTMLDEVIAREPDHATARTLRERIAEERDLGPGRRRKVVETRAESLSTPQPPAVALKPEPTPDAVTGAVSALEPAAPPAVEAGPLAVEAAPPAVEAAPPAAEAAPPAAEAAPPAVEAAPPAAEAAPPAVEAGPLAVEAAPLAVEVGAAPGAAASAVSAAASPSLPAEPAAPTSIEPGLVVLQTLDRAFIYWRLPQLTDALRLRSITVDPSDEGPVVAQEDFALSRPIGGFWLPPRARGAEVRAAVGEVSAQGFTPLTVARVLDGDDVTAFEPLGSAVDVALEAAARLAAGL